MALLNQVSSCFKVIIRTSLTMNSKYVQTPLPTVKTLLLFLLNNAGLSCVSRQMKSNVTSHSMDKNGINLRIKRFLVTESHFRSQWSKLLPCNRCKDITALKTLSKSMEVKLFTNPVSFQTFSSILFKVVLIFRPMCLWPKLAKGYMK